MPCHPTHTLARNSTADLSRRVFTDTGALPQELILEKKGMERVAEAVHQGKMVVAMDDMGWRLEFANDVAASLAGKETKSQNPLVCCSG